MGDTISIGIFSTISLLSTISSLCPTNTELPVKYSLDIVSSERGIKYNISKNAAI